MKQMTKKIRVTKYQSTKFNVQPIGVPETEQRKYRKVSIFVLNEENIERYSHHIEKATEYYHYLT